MASPITGLSEQRIAFASLVNQAFEHEPMREAALDREAFAPCRFNGTIAKAVAR